MKFTFLQVKEIMKERRMVMISLVTMVSGYLKTLV